MKSSARLNRFYREVLKSKTPLLGLTVLQLVIIWLVIGGLSATAIIMTSQQSHLVVINKTSSANKLESKSVTPVPSTNKQAVSQPATTQSATPKESTVINADRCLKLHIQQLGEDINNFRRDNEFLRKNLASVDINAGLQTAEENNALKNKYIKYYNDSRSGSVSVYKQTMESNGCSAYIKEPQLGYVDYY